MVQIPDHPVIREMERTGAPPAPEGAGLKRCVGRLARQAAAELEALSAEEGLRGEAKTARELCGVLRDALALERELRAEERGGAITVRFEGDAARAAE